ncbi:MAG: hypothetical protein QXO27_03245 [Candidatus Aenigmatarchaeota archaeon]
MQQKVPSWLPKVMENLKTSDLKPIFSHEVIVSSMVKATQTKDGVEKEAQVILVFVDLTNLQPTGKYVVSLSTAQGLVNALKTHLDNLEKQLTSKELPKESITPTTVSQDLSYIG